MFQSFLSIVKKYSREYISHSSSFRTGRVNITLLFLPIDEPKDTSGGRGTDRAARVPPIARLNESE
jgi:hypothetical protein